MTGEQLYSVIRAVWRSPGNLIWGLFQETWSGDDSLSPPKRAAWDDVAATLEQDRELPEASGFSGFDKPLFTLEQVRDRLFAERLEHFKGDKKKTAASLGVALKTLYNWINQRNGRKAG